MTLTDMLAALSWRDIIDFLLLFLVAYGVLRLLKGTRAIPVLVSVALLAAAAFVAGELDFVGISVLLKYFLEYIIIILIVVFHQELRRLLVRMGQRLLPQAQREAAETAVEALVIGCDRLAKAKVGALIILEGEFDILQICSHTGKQIDAPLATETLVALAVPHPVNTTHDGAILIREFRIARAGLVCPLSEQTLDPRFGTRHRGAIGVSEDSDSLVIVLSEERGELRVVRGGIISDALDAQQLTSQIHDWIDRPPTATGEPLASGSMSGELRIEAKPEEART